MSDTGVPDEDLAESAERVMAGLIAFISFEFPPRRYKIAYDWVDNLEVGLRNLPDDSDYAITKERAEDVVALAADRLNRLTQLPANRTYADGFADFILQGLGLRPTTAKSRWPIAKS